MWTSIGNQPWINQQADNSLGLRFFTPSTSTNTTPLLRFQVNGYMLANIDGTSVNTSGFALLTANPTFLTNPGSAQSPYSFLHLAGASGNIQQSGYRTWMKDGITFTSNDDLCFIGPRSIQNDVTEFTLSWSDNAGVSAVGPDDLVIRFTSGNGSGTGSSSNEGFEMLRCAPEGIGTVGIGDEFDITAATRPQRRLHVHDPGTNNDLNSQLRLSQNFTTTFTDFRTTSAGNLYLNMTGTQQRVGIEEPAPNQTLDVKGNARFQAIPVNTPRCLIMGQAGPSGALADNILTRLDLNNNANTFLAGNGTWATIPTTCDWNITGSDLTMGYAGACALGNVGIGLVAPDARLTVVKVGTGTIERGVRVNSTGGTNINYGMDVVSGGNDIVYGVAGTATSQSKSYGGYFTAVSSSGGSPPSAIGCVGRAVNLVNTANHIGVMGDASSGLYNVGVKGVAQGNSWSLESIGVYGEAVGSGTLWAMWSQGSSYATGSWSSSDIMLKQDIVPIDNALGIISQIQPKSYNFRTEEFAQMHLPSELQFGVIAQEIEEVLPNLVRDCISPQKLDEAGNVVEEAISFKAVNYIELIPILIQAVKEQQVQIAGLQSQLNVCCSTGATKSTHSENDNSATQQVILSDVKSVILNQNVPNPFAEQTTITYSIDKEFSRAQILFYDFNGKLIQATDIKSVGKGSLQVFADDLSSGIYSYVLVVDGEVIDSKKMVKQ